MTELNLFICGVMCSGKSSVGRELSRRLGRNFLDTDSMIEERTGMSVLKIFAELGEPAFRRFEFDAVMDAAGGDKQIISLGGGTLLNEALRNTILSNGCLVILDVQPDTVILRAKGEGGKRPLLDLANIGAMMAKRAHAYAYSHIRVATDELDIHAAADQIIGGLNRFTKEKFETAKYRGKSPEYEEMPSALS